MASLAQIAQQVIFKMSGGDAQRSTQFDPRIVQLFVLQELNSLEKLEYWNNIKLDEDHGITGQYILTSQVTIQWNDARGECYITVPNAYISLGALDRGIQEIRPINVNGNAFIPLATGMLKLAQGTAMIGLQGNIGYYPEGNTVFFSPSPRAIGITTALIKTIGSTLTNFIADPAVESLLVENVFKKLMEDLPQDKLNDNNPNQQR
jgi:hypothetical protein